MAKISEVSRGRRTMKISQTESAIVFTPKGVHNVLSAESRKFIDDMLTKGEEAAFEGVTAEKFWTVVLPAVTYVKMAQYVREVQGANEETPVEDSSTSFEEDSSVPAEVEDVVDEE